VSDPDTHPPAVSDPPPVSFALYDVWLFDMDGVLTQTATVHAAAWKEAFDEFLLEETKRTGVTYKPFDIEHDYETYVDGEPREDGVRNFLASRHITLPEGKVDDPKNARTVYGVGNRKNALVLKVMKEDGVKVFPGAVTLIEHLRSRGIRVGVVSASKNTVEALTAAGIVDLFEIIVDGNVVASKNLRGKPAPDSYLEGAREFGVDPTSAVVVEDALAGVQAGKAGKFGLVVGVDNHDVAPARRYADALLEHGATLVVSNLADLISS